MAFQSVKFWLYSTLFHWAQDPIVMLISFSVALCLFCSVLEGWRSRMKAVGLIIATGLAAFFGARILHVLIERPELLQTPERIFSRFDGMTFNGSLLFGFAAFFIGTRTFNAHERTTLWNQGVLATAFAYGMLRLACFAKGCCWGSVSGVPWAVKYHHSPLMPWHGIPVHPVQLYDATLGFGIFALLLRRRKDQSSLVPDFLLLYAGGRFLTEFFRGDSFRGEDLLFGLSTSQLVSLGLMITVGFTAAWNGKKTAWLLFPFLLSGCLPKPPESTDFRSIQSFENFELYETRKPKEAGRKNVIFVAADDTLQFAFTQFAKNLYQVEAPPRLEEIAFWQYAKDLRQIYNKILRIPSPRVGYQALTEALDIMERREEPYDLILLTHGMPNHLSTGTGYFFSFRELTELKGKLPRLNLVMLQSCFGSTLAEDFIEAGAKAVLSYEGMNRNFFFFGHFLRYYYPGSTTRSAYDLAIANSDFEMTRFPYVYLRRILPEELLSQAAMPTLRER
jgi:phosphatidylglycerol:prolipoprotein diacylglycerol transferase